MAKIILVSACLLGLRSRYDGDSKTSPRVLDLLSRYYLLPVCPEQMGGLPTPRPPADLYGGDGWEVWAGKARVITKEGKDVTRAFLRGAEEVAKIAQMFRIKEGILKARSPSCGLTPRVGVCAAKLLSLGLNLIEID